LKRALDLISEDKLSLDALELSYKKLGRYKDEQQKGKHLDH
jgi:hypothetical protein